MPYMRLTRCCTCAPGSGVILRFDANLESQERIAAERVLELEQEKKRVEALRKAEEEVTLLLSDGCPLCFVLCATVTAAPAAPSQ